MNGGKEEKPGKRTRRQFDEAYKRQAVELTVQGTRSVRQIADELGVTDSMLYEWRRGADRISALREPRSGVVGR
jgi:transposase-like protein